MTTLLVDDEAPARQLLREYLGAYPRIAIVGEAANGIEAARLIGELRPELVFLDVQMPGLTGLDVVRHLAELPQVIFATAYDQYAIEAFELSAVDYLLKPFTRERLARALDRVLARPHDHLAQLRTLADQLLGQAPKTSRLRKVLVSTGRRIVTIDPADIVRLEADGDYARIVTASATHLSSSSLTELVARLDPERFFRVHRGSAVNVEHLAEVRRDGSTFYLEMDNGDSVRVSRGYGEVVRAWLV